MNRRSGLMLLALCCCTTGSASWLSQITGVHVDITNPLKPEVSISKPDLGAIPEMLQNLPKDVGQALLNPAGSALAVGIRNASKQAAVNAQPIPLDIRQALAPYFPPEILDRARWNLYQSSRISLDGLIVKWFQSEGAVTLDDVIVFSDPSVMTNLELWAHELTHVMQYRNMGVEGFANIYTVAWYDLEQQARDNARIIWAKLNTPQSPVASQTYYSVQPGAFTQSLTNQQIAYAAQNYYPPSSCLNIGGNTISNACPVPVRITDFSFGDAFGRVYWTPCYDNLPISSCMIPAGYFGPALTPSGGPILGYHFIYGR